jgi:tetratricopeptide (TPR) repeat protein
VAGGGWEPVGEHDGQPFIAMQYLAGRSLADALRDRSLTARDAAQCVGTVARAIQFAHDHAVLHRDLKPSNILLDTNGSPLVTDFGLAKLAATDTALTATGQSLGSPNYAPPEQAGSGADVDARGDVYGLGAILYHALTGRAPFQGHSPADVLVQVRERDPIPPRQLDPGIPRDLETICLKCLEKEPAKRYPTAQALADDLDRFLNNEPILARPVTRAERVVRWARRKPALAASLLLVLVLLLFLAIASPIAAYRIDIARQMAEQEADTARAMLAFLRDDLLSVADPFAGNTERPRGRNLTLLAAVDLAARNVRQRFPDQPLVEAGIRVTLWQVYFALGDLDRAEEHIERAFQLYDAAPDAPELQRLKALESMAWMHHARGRYAEATALIEPVLERRARLQGADHPDVLSAQRCRLAILSSSGSHPEAMALGEDLLNRARQLPLEHTEVLLRIMGDVSWNYYRQGEFPRCHALSEEAFHIAQERLGKEHALTIELMRDWAVWLRLRLGRYHEARELQQEAYDRARETLGETHEVTLSSLSELALLSALQALRREQFAEVTRLLAPLSANPAHPSAGLACALTAMAQHGLGNSGEASQLLHNARDHLERLSRAGDLGRTIVYPREEWLPVAHLELACREAELLIHGQRIHPGLDETTLANARERWLPIRTLLDNAYRAAMRGDWPNALDHLRAAIYHDGFHWSAVLQSRENFAAKAALILDHGGELRAHPELIERILEWEQGVGSLGARTFLLLRDDFLTPAALESLVTSARIAAPDGPYLDDGNPWWSLNLGLAELRAGDSQTALAALEPAANAYNLRCAGAANAAAALALWELGEHDLARQRLAQAGDAFQQLTDGNRGSSGPNWYEMLFLELTLQKANELVHHGL